MQLRAGAALVESSVYMEPVQTLVVSECFYSQQIE